MAAKEFDRGAIKRNQNNERMHIQFCIQLKRIGLYESGVFFLFAREPVVANLSINLLQ